MDDARRLIQRYVDHYNTVRLHSAIGFVAPQNMLAGRQVEIHAGRDRKLEAARQQRQLRRHCGLTLIKEGTQCTTAKAKSEIPVQA